MSDSNNYRAIALSSLFDKIMDACIINKQCHVFKFHDLLFAYKANHSTVQCVSTIDKVNLLLLFNKLRFKGMCPLLLRFVLNMYISQNIRVKLE